MLKRKSDEVTNLDGIGSLVQDMNDTMIAAGGIGLSAVQIGVPVRLFVVKQPGTGMIYVCVNPKITSCGKRSVMHTEGCLSLPGVSERVKRHDWIVAEYLNEQGECRGGIESATETASFGHIFQHEYDHLQGLTIPDRLDRGAKDRIRAAMRRNR